MTRNSLLENLVLLGCSDMQQQLSDCQAAQRWSRPAHKVTWACDRLESLKAVREMSAEALAQRVQADALMQYSWPVYWKALKMAYQLPYTFKQA